MVEALSGLSQGLHPNQCRFAETGSKPQYSSIKGTKRGLASVFLRETMVEEDIETIIFIRRKKCVEHITRKVTRVGQWSACTATKLEGIAIVPLNVSWLSHSLKKMSELFTIVGSIGNYISRYMRQELRNARKLYRGYGLPPLDDVAFFYYL